MNKGTKERYHAFCREYHLNGNNGTKAAIAAGYSKKTAHVQATKMLRIPYIVDLLAKLKSEALEKYNFRLEDQLRDLEEVYQLAIKPYFDKDGNQRPENLSAAVNAKKAIIEFTKPESDQDAEALPLNITFEVSPPVGSIKVTNAAT